MLLLKTTSRFLKDLKLAKKRGYDIDKLEAIVDLLQAQTPLPPKNRTIHSPVNGTTIENATSNQTGF